MKRSLLIALVVLIALPSAALQSRVLFTKRSLYRNIMVTDEGDRICLSFRLSSGAVNAIQSCMYKADHDKLVFDYSKSVMAGLLLVPHPKRVLVIGLGGGSIPRVLHALEPKATIDIVEIDQAVQQVAHDWFDYNPTGVVSVKLKDGRQFVKQAGVFNQSYDLIVLDAFNGDYIPEHLMTREFLEECKRILTPDGALVANTFSSSRLYQSESATYAAAFGRFVNLKRNEGNRIIVARRGPPPTLEQLKAAAAREQPRVTRYGVDYATVLGDMLVKPDWEPNARVLTDEWNPANVLRGE